MSGRLVPMSTEYTATVANPPSLPDDLTESVRVTRASAGEPSDGAWVAEVEGLPGSSARGATPEEAVRRALDRPGTAPGAAPDEAVENSAKSANGARRSGRLLVRMPATLHDELARVAEREGVSLNQLITGVLASSVAWRSDARAGGVQTGTDDDAGRITRIAIAVNLAVVALVAVVAIVLLAIALADRL